MCTWRGETSYIEELIKHPVLHSARNSSPQRSLARSLAGGQAVGCDSSNWTAKDRCKATSRDQRTIAREIFIHRRIYDGGGVGDVGIGVSDGGGGGGVFETTTLRARCR